jgi:transposase
MEVIKQIELLSGLGYGKKTIAKELGLSKNTVKSYLSRGEENTIKRRTQQQEVLFAFFPYCKTELARHKGVTRQILWGEYRNKHPDGYSYTSIL